MTLKDWLQSHDFTLSLSSGFFGFFAHCGFVQALYEENCIPKRLTGASAGAIVGGALASGLKPDEIEKVLVQVRKEDFWDPAPGLGLLRGERFEQVLRRHFVDRFEDTVVPFQVSVFDIFRLRTSVLASGPLPRAIRASSTVPLLFHPTRVRRRFYWDGAVADKMALKGVNPQERVLCHYLESKGFFGAMEPEQAPPKDFQQLRIVKLQSLPECGPQRLSLGQSIIRQAREQTRKRLHAPL